MNWKILLVAIAFATIVLGGLPQKSSGASEAYRVVMTAYTCEAHPRNPVYPCGALRWGGNIYARGLACIERWRGWQIEIPGFGIYRCDDTIQPYPDGTLRIDLRVPTLAEALRIGIRDITVYHVDGSQAVINAPTMTPYYPTVTPKAILSAPPPSPAAPPPSPAAPPPSPTAPPPSPTAPPPPTATATPQRLAWTYKDGIKSLISGLVPHADIQNGMIRLLRVETVQTYFPAELLEGAPFYENQPLWLATFWVPATDIPQGTRPKPNHEAEIAAQFLIFDANTGRVLINSFVSAEVLEIMGWIPDDSIDLSRLNRK